ncbi:hypothetical protein ASG58_01355 [Rhizobium sp. Leaf383]|nr:hypothetical protein ASG58_01355 [Rhizobium sp. Leaf383]
MSNPDWMSAGDSELFWFTRKSFAEEDIRVARRFAKCFELIELGYYSEVVVLSHSILDDVVQEMLKHQMKEKGLDDVSADVVIRGIKEQRIKIFLSALLELVSGHSLEKLWSDGNDALAWLNTTRNKIAHNGLSAGRSEAGLANFVSLKIIGSLAHAGLVGHRFPKSMLRTAAGEPANHASGLPAWALADEPAMRQDPVFGIAFL